MAAGAQVDLPPGLDAGPLLHRAADMQVRNASLFGGAGFRNTVKSLVEGASRLGGALYGASEIGERLIGAMVMLSPGLEIWDANMSSATSVVLVDGVVDGPARLEHVAWTLHQLEVYRIAALVVEYFSSEAPQGLDAMLSVASRGFVLSA